MCWRFRCQAHAKGITAVRVQPRGCLVATAGEDGRLRLWDGTTGERRDEAGTGSSEGHWADHLDWSPDGGVLAGTAGRSLHLRHEDGRDEAWGGHPGSIEALAWAPTGRRPYTQDRDSPLCPGPLGPFPYTYPYP